MATIKPLEGRTVCKCFSFGYLVLLTYEAVQVHQIQSGQVIVDLCSVAKELVENSLDASATSIGLFLFSFHISLVTTFSKLGHRGSFQESWP